MLSENKNCGIITYHFAVNYGAVLQCYALRMCLKNIGITAEVINYVSDVQRNNNSLYRKGNGIKGLIKNIVLLPFHRKRSRRQNRFLDFINNEILDRKIDTISCICDLKAAVDEKYEYIISGSDQVFNPRINDFNMAFLFPFNTTAKKIAYAASSGGASVQELMAFKEYIHDFDTITARESSTINVLEQITDKPITEVCDPVFLLKREDWNQIVREVKEDNYLLCYFVKSKDINAKIATAEKIAKEKQLKILIISARISKFNLTHTVISDAGPIEFVSYFAKAEYICTDSFHGTSFSLIFNKPFSTFERIEESADGRKINILRRVGALDRVYYLGNEWSIPKDTKFAEINDKLEAIRHESMKILHDSLY